MNNTLKTTATDTIIIQVIDLGDVSSLTQGAELGWFEYGRPGHSKDRRLYDTSNNEQQAQIVTIGNAAKLTLGHFGPTTEWGRPRWRR